MRYNARDCGVQLTVNLISRLEEEGPTRLYACQSGFEPTTKRFESRALVSSATREAPIFEGIRVILENSRISRVRMRAIYISENFLRVSFEIENEGNIFQRNF